MSETVLFKGNGWEERVDMDVVTHPCLNKLIGTNKIAEVGAKEITLDGDIKHETFVYFIRHLEDNNKIDNIAMAFELLKLGDACGNSSLIDKAFDYLSSQNNKKNALEIFKEIGNFIPEDRKPMLKEYYERGLSEIGWKKYLLDDVGSFESFDGVADSHRSGIQDPVVDNESRLHNSSQQSVREPTVGAKATTSFMEDNTEKLDKLIKTSRDYLDIFNVKKPVGKDMLSLLMTKSLEHLSDISHEDLNESIFITLTPNEIMMILQINNVKNLFQLLLKWSKAECERKQLEVNENNQKEILGSILFDVLYENWHEKCPKLANTSESRFAIRTVSNVETQTSSEVSSPPLIMDSRRKPSSIRRSFKKTGSLVLRSLLFALE